MAEPRIAAYGEWESPITSERMIQGSIPISAPMLDGEDVYWLEGRPHEGGRTTLLRLTEAGEGQTVEEVTPAPFNVRSMVHEYGGGAYTVNEGTVFFSNFRDQQLYQVRRGGAPEQVTRVEGMRYADMLVDWRRERVICVQEDHTVAGREAVNTLVAVNVGDGPERGSVTTLAEGADFYASPRLSADGARLAWLVWRHPNMPWDGTELWLAEVDADGALTQARQVAGGASESVFQPEWSVDGRLYFVSDRSNWWNLYRLGADGRAEALHAAEAEFGAPQWAFGMKMYGFASAETLICTYTQGGMWRIARLDTGSGEFTPFEQPYDVIGNPQVGGERVVFVGASATRPVALVTMDLATGETRELRRSSELAVEAGYLSEPEAIEFPTEHGLTAHAFYYAPRNQDFTAPHGERAPLLVMSHGGPTSATTSAFNLGIQYWTSRGIGVLDVNYGGSTGYGRAYRQRLNGQWGVVDVDDCVNGARYLVEQGRADERRLMIRGGSAGGYTTLCALTFRDTFKAGASYFGISDLEALDEDTHKFESRYNVSMVGPYPEQREVYYQRSPIHFTERLACPIIFFQGLDDKVVLPNQAEVMVEALRAKGLPVAYVAFAGEGHGFRKAENIKRAQEGELYFYGRVLGFRPAGELEPVEIENLSERG